MVDYDAVIIGGGPAGATAAFFLARAGWNVAVVERSEYPRRKVCGEFLSATTLPLLRRLGLGDAWEAMAGPPVTRVGLFFGDATITAPMPSGAGGEGWGRALGREVLDSLLLDAAKQAGAQTLQPWRAMSLRADGQRYACAVQSKERADELRAPVIIAAHGSWESGQLPSQLHRTRSPSDLLAFKAHFSDVDLDHDLMPLLAFPAGYGGMVRCDGDRVSLSCCIRRDQMHVLRKRFGSAPAAASVLLHICESVPAVSECLARARLCGPWLAAGPIRPGVRARYAAGVFRIGNVAGEAHPIVAEGISMALQSGGMLAQFLCATENSLEPRSLQRTARLYAAAWRSQFSGRIGAAAAFAQVAMRPELMRPVSATIETIPSLLTLGAVLSGKSKPIHQVDAPA
jgi:flavin-dependent dehydrogenase